MEQIQQFFRSIKEITFWQRIFHWGKIRALSYDAHVEVIILSTKLEEKEEELEAVQSSFKQTNFEKDSLQGRLHKLEGEMMQIHGEKDELKTRIMKFEAEEEQRKQAFSNGLASMQQVQLTHKEQIDSMQEEKEREIEMKHEEMKRQWSVHEEVVKLHVKQLCTKHAIHYLESVPFTGRPDNAIEIGEEIVIFDAKSPRGEDLRNFPIYIKEEAEKAKKYAKHEGVRNEIYLVVPNNTIGQLSKTVFEFPSYKAFVITKESVELVVLSLKRLEAYEFTEQLSPEERSNICMVIGTLLHTTKRKVQVDQHFIKEMLDIIGRSQKQLPEEIAAEVLKYEKAEKLNPPIERRTKEIRLETLEDEALKIGKEMELRVS